MMKGSTWINRIAIVSKSCRENLNARFAELLCNCPQLLLSRHLEHNLNIKVYSCLLQRFASFLVHVVEVSQVLLDRFIPVHC